MLMPPVPGQRGERPAPAFTSVEPSTQFAARVAAGIFGGEAAVLLAVAALPNPNAILAKFDGVLDEIVKRLDGLDDRVEQLPGRPEASPRDGEAHAGEGAALIDDLNRLVELRYQEMISEAEFVAAKALLFGLGRTAG